MSVYQGPKSHIHNIARGLLIHGEEIVLCRVKDANWFFLPGGHIEDGESARTALLRELHEEIGERDYRINSFIGVCENIFSLGEDILQHEINLIFEVNVPDDFKINSKEDHIEFVSIAKKNLGKYKVLSAPLKAGLLKWLENGEPFLKEL